MLDTRASAVTAVAGTGDTVTGVGVFGVAVNSADFLDDFSLSFVTEEGDECASPDGSLSGVERGGAPLNPLDAASVLVVGVAAGDPAAVDFLAPAVTPAALDVAPELVELATPDLVWPAAPVEVSAWATAEPLANAAPTPRVRALALSHL
ncbi:hypothetical protein [Mycolicibacterium hodleri]|uniref:hypothetical protein n=1 Tax=Mycolicibacterium hodleri TaxID=49897 RepID=UPI001126FD06|nr:hypothetical protein [Mycolicibacterium hodleri]